MKHAVFCDPLVPFWSDRDNPRPSRQFGLAFANQPQPVRPSQNRVLFAIFDLLFTALSSVTMTDDTISQPVSSVLKKRDRHRLAR